jgi:hypothetical protein
MMSPTMDTAREIYASGLQNQHGIENQAIELLERQIGRLENYPEWRTECASTWRRANNRRHELRTF